MSTDVSREIRLWTVQVGIPFGMLVVYLANNDDFKEWLKKHKPFKKRQK